MITLSESGGVRYLHFGTPWVQGAMRMSRPYHIELSYVRHMMSWLLFLEPQRGASLVQLGLGAATLTKYCWKHFPRAQVTAVEMDPQVIRAAHSQFFLPQPGVRLRIVQDDARSFIKNHAADIDVLQVDLYDAQARSPVDGSRDFYADCRAALREPGILAVNLFGEPEVFNSNFEQLLSTFDGRVIRIGGTPEGNQIVLAFNGPPLKVAWSELRERARLLKSRHELPTLDWVSMLRKQHSGAFFSI